MSTLITASARDLPRLAREARHPLAERAEWRAAAAECCRRATLVSIVAPSVIR